MDFKIRVGTRTDTSAAYKLIKELAEFEREPEAVTNTLEQFSKDGFEEGLYKLLVAENSEQLVVGIALYFYGYSTWKGKMLYLDDLVVQEKYRGNGIGQELVSRLFEIAKAEQVNCMRWQVLDWNTPAVEFYEKLGATIDKGWWDCKFYRDDIENYESKK